MRNGAANEPMPQPQQFTADDIHRQQRVNLMMRVLDLECENALLQQEIQQLKNQLADFTPRVVPENRTFVE